MGYHTEFIGVLEFTSELTAIQRAAIMEILGKDCRNHPDWDVHNLTRIDLELLPDYSGLVWDGSEKTSDMPGLVNVVITQMRKVNSDFGLSGKLLAQGQAVGDIWELYIAEDGFARKRQLTISEAVINCPHCGERINLGNEKET